MKKLDDLVFKNLHGLKDEEDEAKHKHDKKAPGDNNMGTSQDPFSQGQTQTDYNKMLELQQQQQQLMYNYYMMQQRQQQQQQNPQYGGQQLPPFNPAFVQNMQNMQNMQNRQQMQAMQNMQPHMNMNASNTNNPFGPMSMGNQSNQFTQMNRAPQQNQYGQMYQNQMNQGMHSGQAGQFGQMNQGFQSGNQNFQAKKAAPANDFDDFGDFSTSTGNQQQNQGYPPSTGFKAQGHNPKHDDDFADFQGASGSQQHAHAHGNQPSYQNFGQSNMGGFSNNFSAPADDFDDFQDSTGGKAGQSTTQASTTKGDDFTDFQNPGAQAEGQNWDLIDDFVGKKPEKAPNQTAQSHPQSQVQQGAQASNLPHHNPNVTNVSMPTQNIHFHPGMQNLQNLQAQPNFFGAPQMNQEAARNMNFYNQGVVGQQGNNFGPQKDEDDFADFEEAKPTHAGAGHQAKPAEKHPQNAKEDMLFGALENKVLKTLGYSHTELPEGEGFGGFEEAKPQQAAHEADDFEEFEQATTGKVNPVNVAPNVDYRQENTAPDKKLTIYDIDLSEFGITENAVQIQSASQGLGIPPEDKPLEKPQNQNVEIQEEFDDFVEVRDETENKEPEQVNVTYPVHPQGQGVFNAFGQVDSNAKPQDHPAPSDWDFGDFGAQHVETKMENKPQQSHKVDDDDEFNDFEGPQVEQKEDVVHIQDEGDGFDDFHVVGSTHNKNDFEALEVKKETEEKTKQNRFEDFEFEKAAHPEPQGNDWYKDFVHPDKEAKVAHVNEQPTVKAQTEFADLGFNFSSVTISAGDKQTTIINEKAPEDIKQEEDEDFEDFAEYKNVDGDKKETEKFEDLTSHKEQAKPAEKEDEEEDFGDFEGEAKPEKEDKKVHEEVPKEEPHKEEDLSKKLTIYDIDLAEFGIQEGSQPGLPQMDLNLNFGKASQAEQDSQKKEEKKPTGISDLYSLYEHTSGTPISTPITAEHPKAENLFGETLETQNIQDTEQTGKHALSPQEGNDDFDDFADFSAAPKQEANKTPEKGDDIFSKFNQGSSGKKKQDDHDFDFGNFESTSQPSKPGTHHEISHAKEEPKVHESHGADDHDDFDNFEEAGHAEEKPVKEELAHKSFSPFEGHAAHRDESDFGSLNEVGHHDAQPGSSKKSPQQAGPRGSTELDRGISIEAPERHGDDESHDDFGSFANAEQKRKRIANLKDESIFHHADSSDYSPAKEKEIDEHDEFGDFVASKQDIKGKTQEVIVEEVEQFTLETVLAEYGIKDEEEPEEVDLTQYIEKRVDEINSEYQANLSNTSYARTELGKAKFKLTRQIIEEIVKELSSIQKFREANNCEGQLKVLEELDTLNDTKRQLIEDEKLEEAIQYRDLIKNKEKELITKEKLEEFLSYSTSDNAKSDYRVVLLEELKAAQVPVNYINDFCLRFIGNLPKILKKTNIIQIQKPEEIITQPLEPQTEKQQGDDSYHKIEQPVKEHEENEDFGDFEGENQTPAEVQGEEKAEEKAEEQPEPVEKKEESHEKIESQPIKDHEDDEDFGDFEGDHQAPAGEVQDEANPEEKAEEEQPESIEKKEESHEKIENQPAKDNEDEEDFGDFEGENQTPAEEVQVEVKPEEKAEEVQPESVEKEEESHEKIESQPAKDNEDEENFGDFEGEDQTPAEEVQGKEKFEEKAEEVQPEPIEKKNDSQVEEANEDFGDFENSNQVQEVQGEKSPEDGKEPQTKPEDEKVNEGFGDFEDSNQPEIKDDKEEKEEKENQKEENEEDTKKDEQPAENHDQASSDFENVGQVESNGEPLQKEEGHESPENKDKSQAEEQEEGFGDFNDADQAEGEKGEKEDNNEKEGEIEVINQNTEVQKEDEGEDFEDFKHVEDEQKQEESANVDQEAKSPEEDKAKDTEELQNEDDEGFGEFEDTKQVPEEAPKEQGEQQEKQEAEDQEDEEDFGDFEGQEQKDQEKNEEVVQKEEEQEQQNKVPSEKEEGNEDFGEFEDFNQNQNQPETETKEAVNEEKEEKAEAVQVVEEKEANNDFGDFEDFSHPEPAATRVEERHVEVYYIDEEEIETLSPAPKNLLELQNLKEETTKWALLAKVIGTSGNRFDSHVKKLLNQIVFELHRFTKYSEKIFNDTNRNSAKMVITSSKYETYAKGIQIFISFYKELKTAYEFLNTRKQPTKLYQKPLEDLIAKVHTTLSQIEQDFGKDYTYDVKNESGQDLLLINQDLNAELLAHVCHLSLKIHVKKLTEYSGKHYFLPYLNFLLNIS